MDSRLRVALDSFCYSPKYLCLYCKYLETRLLTSSMHSKDYLVLGVDSIEQAFLQPSPLYHNMSICINKRSQEYETVMDMH
jgi:hypothetical protein